ncbi:MAG: 30S ribosomal protein S12 methylthiotransferase RimO [Oscillospiraceae bacterium]|nr:30S ribosomal protein S12 methylthiotransferase RimO [Oscillospiraceae bacterium]MDD7354890.1 30S ribosomal protein S12 methylthiotransferase RimO [Oscillospiraceae bacterium]MDY3937424.1 30S ribosomal protein S12 methylthiotransferase RimO [Oscillospiraceae bacterium]
MSIKVGLISLGCPKNQVDSEMMLAKLNAAGYEIVDDAYSADIVVINTCGFIEDAKKEAIENILEMADLKKDGVIKKILVCGCLAQRYKDEVIKEMPEIDGIMGIGNNGDIVEMCDRVMKDEAVEEFADKESMPIEGERILSTPAHWAYLKIADGCSNCCTYCAIPMIRGRFRSRTEESIVKEAEKLASDGVKELILIAQDVTRYGEDLYHELRLPSLLKKLCKIDGIEWIRLLYCYPDRITDELLDVMASEDKILNYIDLPLQHADGKVLKRMNRTGDKESLLALIEKIRDRLPNVIIRTTFITGFPGEGEDEFNTLSEFVDEAQFDRLGCFAYSPEENTPAAEFEDQVDDDVKQKRGEIIMEQQYDIFSYKQKQLIDTVQRCVVDGYDAYTDSYFGRTWMDAPEIDSAVFFTSRKELDEGDMVDVKIFDTKDYDLMGEVVE